MALGNVFLPVLRLFLVGIIPPLRRIPDDVLSNNTLEKSSFLRSRLFKILDDV